MSEVRKLARLGGDVRKIAALLQSKAPKGHHLAYINDREAALLKSHGGSGHVDEETGVRSYNDGMTDFSQVQGDLANQPMPAETAAPTTTISPGAAQSIGPDVSAPQQTTIAAPQQPSTSPFSQAAMQAFYAQPAGGTSPYVSTFGGPSEAQLQSQLGVTPGAGAPAGQAGYQPPVPEQPAATGGGLGQYADKALKALTEPDTLKKLGLAGLGTIPGIMGARRAQAQGQAAKAEQQALAAPYQAQGQQLQAQAQSGMLSAANQQALQAAQAQMQQQAAARGGVGVEQQGAQIAALRQQLLNNQFQMGVQLSGIGDQIALGAIRTGLQADQYVANLQQNYFTNLARVLGNYAPETTQQAAARQQAPSQ